MLLNPKCTVQIPALMILGPGLDGMGTGGHLYNVTSSETNVVNVKQRLV